MIHTGNTTDSIFIKLKELSFKKIFNRLDSDGTGIISSFNIDFKSLNNQIYQIFKPIIDELRTQEESLNFEEFICASEKLFNVRFCFYMLILDVNT